MELVTNWYKFGKNNIKIKKFATYGKLVAICGIILLLPNFLFTPSLNVFTNDLDIVIENEYVKLRFSNNFTLHSIEDKTTGETYYFVNSPLWKIDFLDASGNISTITPRAVSEKIIF